MYAPVQLRLCRKNPCSDQARSSTPLTLLNNGVVSTLHSLLRSRRPHCSVTWRHLARVTTTFHRAAVRSLARRPLSVQPTYKYCIARKAFLIAPRFGASKRHGKNWAQRPPCDYAGNVMQTTFSGLGGWWNSPIDVPVQVMGGWRRGGVFTSLGAVFKIFVDSTRVPIILPWPVINSSSKLNVLLKWFSWFRLFPFSVNRFWEQG